MMPDHPNAMHILYIEEMKNETKISLDKISKCLGNCSYDRYPLKNKVAISPTKIWKWHGDCPYDTPLFAWHPIPTQLLKGHMTPAFQYNTRVGILATNFATPIQSCITVSFADTK